MKVTHLSTRLGIGAGLGALRLHQALLKTAVQSQIVCERDDVFAEQEDVSTWPLPRFARLRRVGPGILRRLGVWTPAYYRGLSAQSKIRKEFNAFFSPASSFYRLDRNPLVQAADIVHLHWICGFVDIPTFFRRVKKPIVWTLRDEWPLLGGFHYRELVPANLPPDVVHCSVSHRNPQRISPHDGSRGKAEKTWT